MDYNVTVLFFATLKSQAGTDKTLLDLPEGSCVRDLKSRLRDRFPDLSPLLDTSVVAINREFAFDGDLVPKGSEVAIFPPVSGGVEDNPTIVSITAGDIDLNNLISKITLPTSGAAAIFTGMVRALTRRGDPHDTVYLEYEAYHAMAEEKMLQVAQEIRNHWPGVQGIAIVQRVGRLYPGTPTVIIACTSAHRDMGIFEAARYGIDRLKEIVPVWKKEIGPNQEVWVEGKYLPRRGD